jgi:hypothetical protein
MSFNDAVSMSDLKAAILDRSAYGTTDGPLQAHDSDISPSLWASDRRRDWETL